MAIADSRRECRQVSFHDLAFSRGGNKARPEDAVEEFQAAHNVAPDGIIGPNTWAALGL